MDITLSASVLPGVTLGLSSKLSDTAEMANCEMSKIALGKDAWPGPPSWRSFVRMC